MQCRKYIAHQCNYVDVMSCHVMSCHVMSCHVMSCHVMSCHVMSCHVMSCVSVHGHNSPGDLALLASRQVSLVIKKTAQHLACSYRDCYN